MYLVSTGLNGTLGLGGAGAAGAGAGTPGPAAPGAGGVPGTAPAGAGWAAPTDFWAADSSAFCFGGTSPEPAGLGLLASDMFGSVRSVRAMAGMRSAGAVMAAAAVGRRALGVHAVGHGHRKGRGQGARHLGGQSAFAGLEV